LGARKIAQGLLIEENGPDTLIGPGIGWQFIEGKRYNR
jgi:hypothetical protein